MAWYPRCTRSGGGTIVAVSVRTPDGHSLLPCGRCRQVLLEAGGPGLLVDTGSGPVELDRLLPSAFTGADLPASGAGLPGSGRGPAGSGAGLPASGGTCPAPVPACRLRRRPAGLRR